MFRMLVHPSSGACDLFVELFHGLYCSGSMCVGVTVWFGWGGVVSLCRLKHCSASACITRIYYFSGNNKASDIKLVYLYSTNNVITSQGKVLTGANIPIGDQSDILATAADFRTEITLK